MSANSIPLHIFEVLEEEYDNLYGASSGRETDSQVVWMPVRVGEEAAPGEIRDLRLPNVRTAHSSDDAIDRGAVKVEGKTWLPFRAEGGGLWKPVEAARDWQFRQGHLRDADSLVAEILNEVVPDSGDGHSYLYDEWAKKNLREHLLRLLDRRVLQQFSEVQHEYEEASQRLKTERSEHDELAARLKSTEREEDTPLTKVAELAARRAQLDESISDLESRISRQPDRLNELDESLCKELNKLLDNKGLYSSERFPKGWLSSSPLAAGLARLHESSKLEGEELRQLNRLLLERAFPAQIEKIHHIRLAAIHQKLHARRPKALSLSGGGIRSGTFALGLLQGLARHRLLDEFDYLSTVSGGGYVGSWLTAWLHRHPEGLAGVTRDLANNSSVSKIDPDPQPIRHLREYSNFLTPKAGALTADTWTFAGIYLRNLLLNWIVLLPLLIAVLMLPRVLLTYTLYQPTGGVQQAADGARPASVVLDERGIDPSRVQHLAEVPEELRVIYEPRPYIRNFFNVWGVARLFGKSERPGATNHFYPRHLLFVAGFLFGIWALGYIGFNRPGVRGMVRERSPYWRDRAGQKTFLRACLLPLVISAICLTTYWAWTQEATDTIKGVHYFLLFGLAFTLGGWIISTLVLRRIWYQGKWRLREIKLFELLGIACAGLLGGLLFRLVIYVSSGFSNPVIGYGITISGDQTTSIVASKPLAWTDWTSWTWRHWETELYVCLAVPIFLLVFWAGMTIFVGVTSFSAKVSDEDREWWARFGAWLLIVSLVWVVLSATVIYGPLLLLEFPRLIAAAGGISALIAVLIGRSALTPAREGAADEKAKSKSGAAAGLVGKSLPLFGLIFLLSLAAAVSLLTTGLTRQLALEIADACQSRPGNCALRLSGTRYELEEYITNVPSAENVTEASNFSHYKGFGTEPHEGAIDSYREFITPVVPTTEKPVARPTPMPPALDCTLPCPSPDEIRREIAEHTADQYVGAQIVHLNILHHTSFWFTLLLLFIAAGAGLLLSRFINLNYFSLHAGYRNRLIRAFLGASRPPGQRRPNPFTGFDPADNIHMHELRPALLDEDDILNAGKLYNELFNQSNPLSRHLVEEDLLRNTRNESGSGSSPSLIGALRSDLNEILETKELYNLEFAKEYLERSYARRIMEKISFETGKTGMAELRGSYRILLNRLVLAGAYPKLIKPGGYPPPPYKLLHVINTSLNLVGGDNLAWQQRKAEPFSVSPLHSGCFRLGYRRSRVYGGRDTGGISIGTAAAVSGAAASSNMGYYTTSPIISLLLTIFNVRLGWWLGNPGHAGEKTYDLNKPKYSVSPIVYEAFGQTNDRYKYVYLTDGGHFENLALYEMVLRRCRFIIVSDGAEDRDYKFGDLGNAVRKIRIDLGVPIEFPDFNIYGWENHLKEQEKAASSRTEGMYWAVGRIAYSCVDKVWDKEKNAPVSAEDGIIIYVKPALYGREPRDVLEYRESFPAFPHQSTGDQFFDEPQFESYRALGSFIMDELCRTFEPDETQSGDEDSKRAGLRKWLKELNEALRADDKKEGPQDTSDTPGNTPGGTTSG